MLKHINYLGLRLMMLYIPNFGKQIIQKFGLDQLIMVVLHLDLIQPTIQKFILRYGIKNILKYGIDNGK